MLEFQLQCLSVHLHMIDSVHGTIEHTKLSHTIIRNVSFDSMELKEEYTQTGK